MALTRDDSVERFEAVDLTILCQRREGSIDCLRRHFGVDLFQISQKIIGRQRLRPSLKDGHHVRPQFLSALAQNETPTRLKDSVTLQHHKMQVDLLRLSAFSLVWVLEKRTPKATRVGPSSQTETELKEL